MNSRKIAVVLSVILAHQNSYAAYSSDASRGSATKTFSVGGVNALEECIVPQDMPGAVYKKKDRSKLGELCEIDFWSNQEVGICPKINSTNPGIDIHKIDLDETTKAEFEKRECGSDDRSQKKIAKFKQSTSCSYTPSILAYFHFSRFLEAGRVKPAVIRTMNIDGHKQQFQKAKDIFRNSNDDVELISKTWSRFQTIYNDPQRFPEVIDSSQKVIYGALQQNPAGELRYTPINGGSGGEDRYKNYVKNSVYKMISSSESAEKQVGAVVENGKLNAQAAQSLVIMKDMSDMLVMDYLLSQQDRMGNIHAQGKWYKLTTDKKGKLDIDEEDADIVYDKGSKKFLPSEEDAEEKAFKEQMEANGYVLITEMILKDNDCGITKENRVDKYDLLDGIKHLSYRTYQNLLALGQSLGSQDFQNYLKRELLFTDKDVATVSENAKNAIGKLKEKCLKGQLLLDLDLKNHLNSEGSKHIGKKESCELKI